MIIGSKALGGMGLADGVSMGQQFGVQLIGIVAVVVWTGVVTWLLVRVIQATLGLRVSEEDELEGLDITSHGERVHPN